MNTEDKNQKENPNGAIISVLFTPDDFNELFRISPSMRQAKAADIANTKCDKIIRHLREIERRLLQHDPNYIVYQLDLGPIKTGYPPVEKERE